MKRNSDAAIVNTLPRLERPSSATSRGSTSASGTRDVSNVLTQQVTNTFQGLNLMTLNTWPVLKAWWHIHCIRKQFVIGQMIWYFCFWFCDNLQISNLVFFNLGNRSDLNKHIKGVHLKTKDYKCKSCDYSCSLSSTMFQVRNHWTQFTDQFCQSFTMISLKLQIELLLLKCFDFTNFLEFTKWLEFTKFFLQIDFNFIDLIFL